MANIFIRGAKRLATAVNGLANAMLAKAPGIYKPSNYGALASLSRPLPFWSLYQIEKMLLDPQVLLCLTTIRGPIHGAKLKVTSPNPEVARFLQVALNRFWKNSLDKVLDIVEYGTMGGEVVYRQTPDGKVTFDSLRDFYISDLKVLVDSDGDFAGLRVQNLKGATNQSATRAIELHGPKAFWATLRAKHGGWYGRSQLRGAYEPWYEKTSQGGAIEIRRLWFYKNAYYSGAMKHPTGSVIGPDGQETPNHDIAREIIEKMATGATVTMPSDVDPTSGKPLWEIVSPTINGNATEIREYPRDLDTDISKGMLVPPEVLEANEGGGSGYAGRKVPQDAFYTGEEEILSNVTRAFKERIGDPLVQVNFGQEIEYEIVSEPLKPKDQQPQPGQQSVGQPLNPWSGKFGGQPESGPSTPPNSPPRLSLSSSAPGSQRLAIVDAASDVESFDAYNKILDAIAANGAAGAAKIFADVQRRLKERMFPLWSDGLTEHALSEARAIVAEVEPLIARTISDALLAAWLIGADHVADYIPMSQAARAAGVDEPPQEPIEPLGILFPGDEGDGGIRLPQIEQAANNLAQRNILTRDEFDQLGRAARQEAFTIAGQQNEQILGNVRDMLANLVETGPTLEEFNERLDDVLSGGGSPMNEWHRETVYRTNVQSAYSQAFDEIADHPVVVDEFPYVSDSSIPDARRSDACAWFATHGIDGTNVYRRDDPVYRQFPPPRHFNSLAGDTIVEGQFVAATRMLYSGQAFEIKTAGGKSLTITPNHPVLTVGGMKPAKSLKKGDQLLRYNAGIESDDLSFGISAFDSFLPNDEQNRPTTIQNVFESIMVSGVQGTIKRLGLEFHGDAEFGQGDIEIVATQGELMDWFVELERSDYGEQFGFETSDSTFEALASGNRQSLQMRGSAGATATVEVPPDSIDSTIEFPTQPTRIGRTAKLDAVVLESLRKHRSRNSSFASDLQHRLPGAILLDEIVEIRQIDFCGHVYDLKAVSGVIVADGLIVSNCRTGRNLLSLEDAAARGIREAQDWLRTGEAPANPYRMPYPPAEILRKMFAGVGVPVSAGSPVGLSLAPIRLAVEQLRAPAGGCVVHGVKYAPGEWIPKDVVAKLSKIERKAIESHGVLDHPQQQQASQPVVKKSKQTFPDKGSEQTTFVPPNGEQTGYVWRLQPKGAELHGQKSRASNNEELGGVFVFGNLGEIGAIDWANEDNIELVKIKISDGDTFETHDQEGTGLASGKGIIVARKSFPDVRSAKEWASESQASGWSKNVPVPKKRQFKATEEPAESRESLLRRKESVEKILADAVAAKRPHDQIKWALEEINDLLAKTE